MASLMNSTNFAEIAERLLPCREAVCYYPERARHWCDICSDRPDLIAELRKTWNAAVEAGIRDGYKMGTAMASAWSNGGQRVGEMGRLVSDVIAEVDDRSNPHVETLIQARSLALRIPEEP